LFVELRHGIELILFKVQDKIFLMNERMQCRKVLGYAQICGETLRRRKKGAAANKLLMIYQTALSIFMTAE
jgi:hypothetical protein